MQMKLENNWKYKSLANLDSSCADIPIDYTTRLTEKCTKLLLIPLSDYTVEDLRIMIGQAFGLSYLVPLAIEKLKEDIFVEGDFYPCDLLSNVLNIDAVFWRKNITAWKDINKLISDKTEELSINKISSDKFLNAAI